MKRAGIYVFFDRGGKVHDYVPYLLDALKAHLDSLVIVVNGTVDEEGKARLYEITDNIVIRSNEGYDTWGYKAGLDFYGWDVLTDYDEVVMLNDTVMGPVCDFKEMFDEMEKRELDFWGITMHGKDEGNPFDCEYGYIPGHVQSYFMVFRKSMITAPAFQSYWDNLFPIKDYTDAVGKHECAFTKRFADQGFLWDVYINDKALMEVHNQPIIAMADELVINYKCPIFKKRLFFQHLNWTIHTNAGQCALRLFSYIKDHTDYPQDMLIDALIDTRLLRELYWNFHWNYVVDAGSTQALAEKELPYTRLEGYEATSVNVSEMALDYMTEESLSDSDPGRSNAIAKLFEENAKLGLLVAPEPNYGTRIGYIGDFWAGVFAEVSDFGRRLKITVPYEKNKPTVIAARGAGLIRTEIADKIKNTVSEIEKWEKDPYRRILIVERLLPLLVQQEGYYTGTIMTGQTAAIFMDELRYHSGMDGGNDREEELLARINQMEASKSWKITKPLRLISERIR